MITIYNIYDFETNCCRNQETDEEYEEKKKCFLLFELYYLLFRYGCFNFSRLT